MEKAKVLIVEDEAIIAMEIESQLQRLGYEVTSLVDNGEEAIKKAESDKPDLILMDIRIKGEMDGIEAANIIRSQFEIPIIFMTAYHDQKRLERAKFTIPYGYLLKPVQETGLKVNLEMALYLAKVDAEKTIVEETLRKSEEKYRSLFYNMLNGFAYCKILLDEKGHPHDFIYLEVNDAFEKLTGLKRNEVLNKRVTEAIPGFKDSHPELFDIYGKVALTGEGTTFEIDLKPFGICLSISVYSPQNGYFVALFENITERKLGEKALRESEFLFSQKFEQSMTSTCFYNSEGTIVRVNSEFCRLFGVEKKVILDGRYNIFQDQAIKDADVIPLLKEIFEEKKTNTWKSIFDIDIASNSTNTATSNGGKLYLEIFGYPILDDKGELKYVILQHYDITQRTRAENALQKKTHELGERVKELNCLYGISELAKKEDTPLDKIFQGVVNLIPPAWQYPDVTSSRITFNDQEFRSKNFRDTNWKQTSDIMVDGQNHGSLEICYLEERAEEDEGPFIREERNLINEISKRLGKIIERKKAKEITELRDSQLIQADKMISLGILVSGVAHEINNPNYAIASNIFPLKKIWEGIMPILNEYHERYGEFEVAEMEYSMVREQIPNIFNNISKSSDRIKNIVQELKQFSLEQPVKHLEMIQLNNVVQSALTLLQNMIKKSTKHFSLNLHDDLPMINGNYQQLEQVVINLIQNACQALTNAEGESISISTFCDHQQEVVGLKIVDEGGGIPEESLKRVTDPFFTTKRETGGIGLGLAISSKLIMEHNGSLQFTSDLGKGAIVTVSLPISRRENNQLKQC
jgi:PAS domain S-box-containing protein